MRDERQRSSIYTTAETILEAYADPRVLERSGVTTSIRSRFLDGGRHTLYLSSTVREQRRLRPLFVALIQSVVQAAYERAAATGQAARSAAAPRARRGGEHRAAAGPRRSRFDRRRPGRPAPHRPAGPRAGARPLGTRPGRDDRQQPPREGDRSRHVRSADARMARPGCSATRNSTSGRRPSGDGRHSETRSVTYRSMAPAQRRAPGPARHRGAGHTAICRRPGSGCARGSGIAGCARSSTATQSREMPRPDVALTARPRAEPRARRRAGVGSLGRSPSGELGSSTPNSSRYSSTALAASCHRSRACQPSGSRPSCSRWLGASSAAARLRTRRSAMELLARERDASPELRIGAVPQPRGSQAARAARAAPGQRARRTRPRRPRRSSSAGGPGARAGRPGPRAAGAAGARARTRRARSARRRPRTCGCSAGHGSSRRSPTRGRVDRCRARRSDPS